MPKIKLRKRSSGVGYCKPPVHTRFQPGQSGNPAGRPKGSLNVATVLERTLKEKVVVNEGGRRKEISKLDAAVKQLVNKAASGDARAIQLLLGLAQAVESRSKAAPSVGEALAEADHLVMQSLLTRIQNYAKGDKASETDTE